MFSHILSFIQRFGGNVDAIWPGKRAAVDKEFLKETRIFKWLENGAAKPLRNIDVLFSPVIENGGDDETAYAFGPSDLR